MKALVLFATLTANQRTRGPNGWTAQFYLFNRFNFGATLDFGEGMNVLSTGVMYSEFNSIHRYELVEKSQREGYVNDYLGLALQGKLYSDDRHEDLYVRYGVLLNFLMHSEYQWYVEREDGIHIESANSKNLFNLIDPMATLGVGFVSVVSGTQFVFDFSYGVSVLRITRSHLAAWYNEAMMLNVAFGLFP